LRNDHEPVSHLSHDSNRHPHAGRQGSSKLASLGLAYGTVTDVHVVAQEGRGLTASDGASAARVLVWDILSTGHHPRYLEAVVANAPAGYRLTLPHWTPSELVARAGPTAQVLPPPDGDEWRSFTRAVEEVRPAGVLILEAHRFVRWLALRHSSLDPAIGALDLLVRDAIFGNPSAYRNGLSLRTLAVASASWAAREVLVRRRRASFISLNGWSDRVGSRRLRQATLPLPDLLERLPPAPARPKLRPVNISLVGVLKERKGLADLVAALEQLARGGRLEPADIAVTVVGGCVPGYETQVEQLTQRLRRGGFATDVESQVVSQETLSGALAATDVLVLPYRSHFGSSGFLGSAYDFPQLTVVCSDFGWLGHIAGAVGAVLFRNGSVEDLARALDLALRERPRLNPAADVGYADAAEFGTIVWSSLPPLA
jgi:glycosyltransferase involved in cell wall biosynthesis